MCKRLILTGSCHNIWLLTSAGEITHPYQSLHMLVAQSKFLRVEKVHTEHYSRNNKPNQSEQEIHPWLSVEGFEVQNVLAKDCLFLASS